MTRKKLLLALVAILPLTAWAGEDDDFGLWTSLGVTKNLPRNWSVDLETELRTEDNVRSVDRWSIGAGVNYRVNKYLKLGVAYNYLDKYSADKTSKIKYDSEGEMESYRFTPGYWIPRHRFGVDVSSGVKLWKWLRISGKLKYQYTMTPSHVVDRTDVEIYQQYTENGYETIVDEEPNPKQEEREDRHVLRSRLRLELDKKRVAWSPFVAIEFHNNLADGENMNLDKIRTSVGTVYKINKHHDVSLSYVVTVDRRPTSISNFHALSVGYNYEF